MRYCEIRQMVGCYDNGQKTMNLSKVIEVEGIYPKWHEKF